MNASPQNGAHKLKNNCNTLKRSYLNKIFFFIFHYRKKIYDSSFIFIKFFINSLTRGKKPSSMLLTEALKCIMKRILDAAYWLLCFES